MEEKFRKMLISPNLKGENRIVILQKEGDNYTF